MMLAPNAELRKLQKQERLDWLQALRGEVSKPMPAKLPAQSLPFPTSPPSATSLPEDTLGRDASILRQPSPPYSIVSDASAKSIPLPAISLTRMIRRGGSSSTPPLSSFRPHRQSNLGRIRSGTCQIGPRVGREERMKARGQRSVRRKRKRPRSIEGGGSGGGVHWARMAMRSPMIAVVMELERGVCGDGENRGPTRAAAEAERVAAQQVVEERHRRLQLAAHKVAACACCLRWGKVSDIGRKGGDLARPGQRWRSWFHDSSGKRGVQAGTPFPSQKLIDAREKSRRARLQLKNAERHMSARVGVGNKFHPQPVLGLLRTMLNSRYIKAATRVRTLRKYVATLTTSGAGRGGEKQRQEDSRTAYFERTVFGLKWKLVAVRLLFSFLFLWRYSAVLYLSTWILDNRTCRTHTEVYLVTGRKVECPGAYASWTSADAQYRTVSAATVKGYKSWHALESAWFAGCDRGEHIIPLTDSGWQRPSSPPSPPLRLHRRLHRRLHPPVHRVLLFILLFTRGLALFVYSLTIFVHSLTVCRIAPPPSPPARFPHTPPGMSLAGATSYSPTTGKVGPRTSHMVSGSPSGRGVIPGKMAYAVRSNGQGVVFGSYEQARGYTTSFSRKGAMRHLQQALHLPTAFRFWKDSQWRGALQRLLAGELGSTSMMLVTVV
ncbi:hypothetical protein B0H13DRAFT_1923161 [Mycena leptocephala]|nr:hypothetical protein B0H13DRAFT_1923161 [Mycena leptocephala]